jgi:hypothetical protein
MFAASNRALGCSAEPWNAHGCVRRHGCFDQPHFVRDFRAFSGTHPSDYIRRGEPTWSRPHDPEPGHGRFVRGGDLDPDA